MAWTDNKYVSVAGSGAHDGSSTTNEWTLAEAIAAYAAGQKLNVKAGTYSSGATDRTFGTAGTTTAPILWSGYNTTPGDLDTEITTQRTPGTDMPLFTSTTGRYYLLAAHANFRNIAFTSAYTGAGTVLVRGGRHNFFRCRFETTAANTAAAAVDTGSVDYVSFDSCHMRRDLTTTNYNVIDQNSSHVFYNNCVIEGGNIGLSSASNIANVRNCSFRGQSGQGILAAAGYLSALGNTFYNISGDAIKCTGVMLVAQIRENYFHTIGGYAINNSSGTDSFIFQLSRNCYYGLTSGQTNGITNAEQMIPLTDSGDKFVNAGSNDFTLISSSSGYKYPILFEKDGPTTYPDIGAIRHTDAGGSSGGPSFGHHGQGPSFRGLEG